MSQLPSSPNEPSTARELAKFGCLGAAAFGVLGMIFLLGAMNSAGIFKGFLSFKPKVTVDRSYYYRVTAKYEYLGTPVDFNIVVGCSVEVTDSKLTGKSYMTGIAPAVYGLKLPNGKGLVMRVPEACRGEKTWDEARGPYPNDKMPFIISPRFRPFMAVYDDADKPMFGWGYASDDAYDSPLSELKFVSVRIDAATRQEFLSWRETEASKNIIRRDIISWDVVTHKNWANVKPGHWIFGDHCRGVRLHKMPDVVADAIRPFWPANKPDYWIPDTAGSMAFGKSKDLGSEGRSGAGPYNGAHLDRYPVMPPGFAGERGMLRTKGGGFTAAQDVSPLLLAGEIYPVKSDLTVNTVHVRKPAPDVEITEYIDNVILLPDRKGFVFCDGPEGELARPTKDGRGARRTWRVNDMVVSDLNGPQGLRNGYNWWFYRDEAFFNPIGFGFHATLGGL